MPPDRIVERYWAALATLRQPPWRELIDPGPLRFLERSRARRAAAPVRCQAPLFFGATMEVVLPEVVSEQIHAYGLFDDVVTWLALCAVEPGDVVFDVGAHFNYFSLLFAALSGPQGRVFPFEPTPSTFRVLAGNVAADPRIRPLNAAAGAQPGRLPIADYGLKYSAWNTLDGTGRLGPGNERVVATPVEVEVVTLDGFAAAGQVRPAFIKIDAENFEPEVLAGAARILEQARPSLLLEAGSPRAAELARSLARSGYRAFSSEEPGRLEEFPDAGDAALRCKDVLFAAGPRADRLAPRARAAAACGADGPAAGRAVR